MLKSKLLVLNTTVVLGLSSIFAASGVSAESISDMENKKKKIQDQRSNVQSNIQSTDAKIKALQDQQAKTKSEMQKIDEAISSTNAKITEKNEEITSTKADIEKLKKEIEELKERIAKRNEVLKNRALTYQENGGSNSYLEVILGASSFGEFIERIGAVSTIMDADQDLVKQHEADKEKLESNQKKVESKLASLEKMRSELQSMKATLSKQRAEKDKLMGQLEHDEHEAHTYKMDLQEENDVLASQHDAINKAIANEKARQAEAAKAERERQAALERARQEAAKKAASGGSHVSSHSSSNSSSSNSSSNSGSSHSSAPSTSSTPGISAGAFTRPAVGVLSSGFGGRWGATHFGVDIANPVSVPIVAAADGVVARSYYSSSYGNAVFISHSINGKLYTTVYAHMNSRNVSTGQTVSKGQQIGMMGNTGQSTGQHLHFELHEGPWTPSKSGAINPIGIVPL
ncbi:murein hydrolase activator EnvC family protein [Bacillus testis]|uniref:murein hydrolase activator EnvC family protein n=1 Tax=Bacillus testis TaxID=1622072 RepID=UPI00067E9D51|nr:peptidoglycan DD-metalloendopeptidase family protein [Bacillus testis]